MSGNMLLAIYVTFGGDCTMTLPPLSVSITSASLLVSVAATFTHSAAVPAFAPVALI